MKNIWRIALLGYLFGMFALIICIIAVVTGIVEDMSIALLALPVISPILLILFRHISKCVWGDELYGYAAFRRWAAMGAMVGCLYTVKVFLEDKMAYPGLLGVFLLLLSLLAFWLIFFNKKR